MPPKMYAELASWFHLITAPEDYEEEAAFFVKHFTDACITPPQTVLELGSGGGNNASHMKAHFEMTLVDLSPQMLALSETINPELEHITGDMRTVRLGRQGRSVSLRREFDAVFVHDAVSYMTTKHDLRAAFKTAFLHCRPGGAALFAPDNLVETFEERVNTGGHTNEDGRSMRYLEWTYDPNPKDTICQTDYAYILREADGAVRVEHDQHITGLFPRRTWLQLLSEAGFDAEALPFDHSTLEPGAQEIFIAKRPASR